MLQCSPFHSDRIAPMARRPRSRTSRAFPKTLTGILASIALAVLAALGIKTDGFHGKPSAPPTERPTVARTTPPPGNLPNTPGTFTAAKKAHCEQVYADHRITVYCGCRYDADRRIEPADAVVEDRVGLGRRVAAALLRDDVQELRAPELAHVRERGHEHVDRSRGEL